MIHCAAISPMPPDCEKPGMMPLQQKYPVSSGTGPISTLPSGDQIIGPLITRFTPASAADWDEEYLDLVLSVKIVDGVGEAIEHINTHGSGHTETIVTGDSAAAKRFQTEVDSSTIFWNASTRFSDGMEFGMGAEIGISTDKIGARGPMGLEELTSYKWLGVANGLIRK